MRSAARTTRRPPDRRPPSRGQPAERAASDAANRSSASASASSSASPQPSELASAPDWVAHGADSAGPARPRPRRADRDDSAAPAGSGTRRATRAGRPGRADPRQSLRGSPPDGRVAELVGHVGVREQAGASSRARVTARTSATTEGTRPATASAVPTSAGCSRSIRSSSTSPARDPSGSRRPPSGRSGPSWPESSSSTPSGRAACAGQPDSAPQREERPEACKECPGQRVHGHSVGGCGSRARYGIHCLRSRSATARGRAACPATPLAHEATRLGVREGRPAYRLPDRHADPAANAMTTVRKSPAALGPQHVDAQVRSRRAPSGGPSGWPRSSSSGFR